MLIIEFRPVHLVVGSGEDEQQQTGQNKRSPEFNRAQRRYSQSPPTDSSGQCASGDGGKQKDEYRQNAPTDARVGINRYKAQQAESATERSSKPFRNGIAFWRRLRRRRRQFGCQEQAKPLRGPNDRGGHCHVLKCVDYENGHYEEGDSSGHRNCDQHPYGRRNQYCLASYQPFRSFRLQWNVHEEQHTFQTGVGLSHVRAARWMRHRPLAPLGGNTGVRSG